MSQDPIVQFYRGEQRDAEGRSIDDVWAFHQTNLEDTAHYLEWLFPLKASDATAPGDPAVTEQTRDAFAQDADLRERLRRSLDLMLAFYGMSRDGETVGRSQDFESRRLGWLYPGDHNHERLSRVVRSLALLGEGALASSLRDELVAIADDYGAHSVSRETRGHWAHLLDD